MALPASEVAAVLRARIPGLPVLKLHKLLYYCQGHHLATFGEALFGESLSAWDMGPVVGSLWFQEQQQGVAERAGEMSEAELNTIGYVLSRYGALSGQDLIHLTHSETPWQLADAERLPGTSARIRLSWIEQYFRTSGADGDEEVVLDAAAVADWLRDAATHSAAPARPDDPEELSARLASLQERTGQRA